MAVKLRLKRFGRKKLPIYRLVVADERAPRDGKVIEEVGFYHPTAQPKVLDFKQDRIDYWLSVGAKLTDPVERLLGEAGIIKKVTRIRGKAEAEAKAKEEAEKAAAEAAEAEAKAKEEAEKAAAEAAEAEAKAKEEAEKAAAEAAEAEAKAKEEAEKAAAEPEAKEEAPVAEESTEEPAEEPKTEDA